MSKRCHYGCWFMRKCMGYPRAEVIEFLSERDPDVRWEEKSDEELDRALLDLADVDYRGPDHVRVGAA